MRFSSYYPSKLLPLKLAKFDPGFSRQAAGGPRGTMSTVVTYRSRAPVRLSQRRLRKGSPTAVAAERAMGFLIMRLLRSSLNPRPGFGNIGRILCGRFGFSLVDAKA